MEAMTWDELWCENPRAFNQWPETELVRWASTLDPGSKVLEVGCGSGCNLRALQSFDLDPWGVDIAEEAVRRCTGLRKPSQVKVGSAVELPFPDSEFDAVADVQCLQHLASDQLPKAYSEIHRVLKPHGQFFEMALCVGMEHFPALQFNRNTGRESWLNDAGFKVTDDGLSTRLYHRRPYAYRVLECERV